MGMRGARCLPCVDVSKLCIGQYQRDQQQRLDKDMAYDTVAIHREGMVPVRTGEADDNV